MDRREFLKNLTIAGVAVPLGGLFSCSQDKDTITLPDLSTLSFNYQGEDGKSVLELLKRVDSRAKFYEESQGILVTEIMGLPSGRERYYWEFLANGKFVENAHAGNCITQKSDVVEWRYFMHQPWQEGKSLLAAPPGLVVAGACNGDGGRSKIKLDVYFIPQLPPGTDWKQSKNCGQASVLNCVGYLKRACFPYTAITDENKWLATAYKEPEYLNTYGYYTGGERIYRLEGLARNYWGYKNSVATVNYCSTIDALYNELKAGRPVVVEVITNMAPAPVPNGDTYHFMVLVGMDSNYVWVNDVGKPQGKDQSKDACYSLQQFTKSWATSNNHCVFIR